MRRYSRGSSVALRLEIDGDADVALLVEDPDGAPTTAVVERLDEGVYEGTVSGTDVDLDGVWDFHWRVTGDIEYNADGQFYVSDPDDDLPPLAPFSKLVNKLGYAPEGPERDRAEHLLDEASELIRDVAGKSWTDDDGALADVPRRVALICVAAAFRAFTNPEGLTQRSIGDSSKSFDRTGREGGEAVFLTDDERRAITKAAGVGAGSMVSVGMTSTLFGPVLDPWVEATLQ